MRNVSINKVKVGDIVGLPIYGDNDKILVNTGFALSESIISRLIEIGIPSVTIDDSISSGIDVSDNISLRIKNSAVGHLKNFNLEQSLEDANSIVDELKGASGVYEYINTKTFDNYTYEHSVSVAVYSAMIGLAAGYNDIELRKLCQAAILHDIGKKSIAPEILHKPARLTPEEYEEIKKHASLGYNMLSETDVPATVKIVSLQHHENEDGSGYPKHLMGKDIYKYSKIVHIADVYDAMLSKRPYKEPMDPKQVIEFITSKRGKMFDEYYVDIFIQVMPYYAKGSILLLSNGKDAIVMKNTVGNIDRPIVRIVDTNRILDLSNNPDIEIIDKL